jgi:hypothetical protein
MNQKKEETFWPFENPVTELYSAFSPPPFSPLPVESLRVEREGEGKGGGGYANLFIAFALVHLRGRKKNFSSL